jgi:hypothetical protein
MVFLPFAIHVDIPARAEIQEKPTVRLLRARFCGDDGLTETAGYCAAARIGMSAFKKWRTRSIVRCLSSSGSFHG